MATIYIEYENGHLAYCILQRTIQNSFLKVQKNLFKKDIFNQKRKKKISIPFWRWGTPIPESLLTKRDFPVLWTISRQKLLLAIWSVKKQYSYHRLQHYTNMSDISISEYFQVQQFYFIQASCLAPK